VVPVPTPQVRRHIEAERRRRVSAPLHTQEREDAPPHVLQALWQELVRIAPSLGVTVQETMDQPPYDPVVYQGVYQALLKHRQVDVLCCETLLPTTTFSVYDFASQPHRLAPTAEAVQRFIHEVACAYPDGQVLQRDLEHWYRV
jgi:hypothetical protein